jgi:hypothetical protein
MRKLTTENYEECSWDEVATCRRRQQIGWLHPVNFQGAFARLSPERLRIVLPGTDRMEGIRSLGPR